jgi:hypothetical protein
MVSMNITQTQYCLDTFPNNISILIVGDHGLGKSQTVIQHAEKHNRPCIDFRLSQVEASDLIGMPYIANGRSNNAKPWWFPMREEDELSLQQVIGHTAAVASGAYGKEGVLFLDELNRAPRDVQQAVFELIHDRRLHGHKLPDGWRVVSAINGDSDIYTTTKMEPAMLSRFFVIEFKPTYEEWLHWADAFNPLTQHPNVHPVITEFIRKNDMFLDATKEEMESAKLAGIQKVNDRRSWHKFSEVITKSVDDFEASKLPEDPLSKQPKAVNWMFQLAGGFVGPTAQAKFKDFLETDYQALDANIIINKMTDEIAEKLEVIVAAGRIPELAAYNELVLDYLEKNVPKEFQGNQARNLAIYFRIVPHELRSDLWTKWNKMSKHLSETWYHLKSLDGSTSNSRLVLDALVNPDAKKKTAAQAVSRI